MIELPQSEIHDYDLGKHWPETGDYQQWLEQKLTDFRRNYVYISHATHSTNTGGTLLIARGVARKRYADLFSGRACPECIATFEQPESTADHLEEKHRWAHAKVMEWLKYKLEEEAFNDEP